MRCPFCKKTFTNRKIRESHLSALNSDGFYYCCVCSNKSSTKSLHTKHMHVYHPKPFQCDLCSKCFATNGHLAVHKGTHTGEKPFQCKICKKSFRLNSALSEHMNIHSGKKPHKCTECSKRFASVKYLKTHMKMHSASPNDFVCIYCGRGFSRKELIKSHMQNVHLKKAHVCAICKKRFTDKTQLNRHFLCHSKEPQFNCHYCGKGVYTRTALIHHISSHSQTADFRCDICNAAFKHQAQLYRHKLWTHTGIFKCNLCNIVYKSEAVLVRHVKLHHTTTRDYYCRKCKKSFDTYRKFSEHQRTHWKLRCSICFKLFSKIQSLNCHMKLHTETYKCSWCFKGFAKESSFKSHACSRTVKLYRCINCTFVTQNRKSLVNHFIRHTTKKRPLKCEHCFQFSRNHNGSDEDLTNLFCGMIAEGAVLVM